MGVEETAAKLERHYIKVEVRASGPRRTTKIRWDDLGLPAEMQANLEKVTASSGSYGLVSRAFLNKWNADVQRARAKIQAMSVYASEWHIIPAFRVDEAKTVVAGELEAFQDWLGLADLDDMQTEVRRAFIQHVDSMVTAYGPVKGEELKKRVLDYVTPQIPTPEQLRSCTFRLDTRTLGLVPPEEVASVVADTVTADMERLVEEIPRRVAARLEGTVSTLANAKDLQRAAMTGQQTIRNLITFAVENNVILGDPLVAETAEVLLKIVDSPSDIGPVTRGRLQELAVTLKIQRELLEPSSSVMATLEAGPDDTAKKIIDATGRRQAKPFEQGALALG